MALKSKRLALRNTADALTLLRVLLCFPILITLSNGQITIAWSLLLICGLTDVLDGIFARAAGGGSYLGAKLDPLADKICLLAPMIWLVSSKIIPFWSAWIVIARELLISTIRSDSSTGLPASRVAKSKTFIQFVSILFILLPTEVLASPKTLVIKELGLYLYWISIFICLWSGVRYIKQQIISDQKRNQPDHFV